MRTTEHSAYILSFSVMRSVSSRWNFQRIAYLSAVSILLEDTLAAVGHRVYFRSLYSTQKHAIQTSLLLFFPRRRSSVEPSPIRMNISPGMRVAARRHKSFLRATTVALFCRTRPGGRAKKCHSACIRHHRCRERCYTGREYCNPRVTSRKTGRDSSLLRAFRPLNSPTLGQNRARCVRATS